MARVKKVGDWRKTKSYLKGIVDRKKHEEFLAILRKYGEIGVTLLSEATPKKTGKTAASWSYEIVDDGRIVTIVWKNSNYTRDYNIAVILDIGHGKKGGGYVRGRRYIKPALLPVMDSISKELFEEVKAV